MLRHPPLVRCTLLLLLASLSGSGEGRPGAAHSGTRDGDRTSHQKVLLLEAVKTGILSSLGMGREPRPNQRATEQELREMYQLYREKLREMRGNSSQPTGKAWQSTVSTVLLPEPIKVLRRGALPRSGRRTQWYRAIFTKNPKLQTELTLARAELKISRQISSGPSSGRPEPKQQVKVRVQGLKPANSAARIQTDSLAHANVSSAQALIMDLSAEVEEWMKAGDGGQALVVDVGVVADGGEAPEADPTVSLELGLVRPKLARRRRSRTNKEDVCDERGWCCRMSVTVSFQDIGWADWVVAPAEYTMHFCDGTCPHNYKPASMHAQVKSRLHQITKGGTPRPCCVPTAYEPMVLMHYDSRGKLKLTPFNDFIVSKCHCA